MPDLSGWLPLPISVSASLLDAMAHRATELARAAGAEILAALGRAPTVRYKPSADGAKTFADPVSELDENLETMIRAGIARDFPDHAIVGEERPEGDRASDIVWTIDPIDGTANFVNGLPLFAVSIGVLCRGVPVAAATSHALRPGVYHCRHGQPLAFDGEPLEPRRNPAVRRHLAAEPRTPDVSSPALPWDVRVTGSAAIECAFVAAGLLRAARFDQPNIWDVGGGLALVQAAGGVVCQRETGQWIPFRAFTLDGDRSASVRDWRASLILGEPSAVDLLCATRR